MAVPGLPLSVIESGLGRRVSDCLKIMYAWEAEAGERAIDIGILNGTQDIRGAFYEAYHGNREVRAYFDAAYAQWKRERLTGAANESGRSIERSKQELERAFRALINAKVPFADIEAIFHKVLSGR